MFGLAAVLNADDLTPSPPTMIATPTQASTPVVPSATSTKTPTPAASPIIPTPVISEVSPVEETPTSESTPVVKTKSVVPSSPPEWLQGEIIGETGPTTTPSVEVDSTPTPTFAMLLSPTVISMPQNGPTTKESDLPSGNLALPAYLGIVISMVLVLVGGATYVYRFRLSLYLENAPYGRILSRALTYRSFGYLRYRWDKAKSEWDSARKHHRQAIDRYQSDNQEEILQEAETRHDEAFKRLRRAIRQLQQREM